MNQIRHIEDIARGLLVGRTHPPLGRLREPPASRPATPDVGGHVPGVAGVRRHRLRSRTSTW